MRQHPAGPGLRAVRLAVTPSMAPLGNRLQVTGPAVFATTSRQPYGLTGPVRVVPFGQARMQGA
ncbi:hypothetical protein ACWERI_28535 [Streptomyces collinus]